MEKNNNALFYTCSLIEYIGRETKQKRSKVVELLGAETMQQIYQNADILHCEPIIQTATVFIGMKQIPTGDFDNVAACQYAVPDYWDIGEVFSRLIEDLAETEEAAIDTLFAVYTSNLGEQIENFNSDLFYQSREYLLECYKAGEIL